MGAFSLLALDVLLLALLAIPGALIARLAAPDIGKVETAAVAFPLGAGLFTFVVFVTSWMGVPIVPFSLATTYLILVVLPIVTRCRMAGPPFIVAARPTVGEPKKMRLSVALWLVVGLLVVVSAVISVGRSHTPFDGPAIWASKGYGIAKETTIFAADVWGAHGLGYPLNIPLTISVFQLADGDALPGSKLVFPVYYLSLLVGAAGFWRRLNARDLWILAGVLVLGTIPELFRHSTYTYVNLPASAYLALGTIWAVTGLTHGRRGDMLLAGLLLGLACWTRVEGVLFALAILAAVAGARWYLRGPHPFPILWLLGPVVAIGGTWLAFYRLHGLEASQAGGSMAALVAGWREGNLRLHSLRLILGYFRRELLDVETWGLLFPMAAAVIIANARKLIDRSVPEAFPLALASLGTGLATATLFYVGSYQGGQLVGWLTRGFPRAFFPTAILLVILAVVLSAARQVATGKESLR
jgi:hypothetical protein